MKILKHIQKCADKNVSFFHWFGQFVIDKYKKLIKMMIKVSLVSAVFVVGATEREAEGNSVEYSHSLEGHAG